MRSIDIHAHLEPQCFQRAIKAGQNWHGLTSDSEEADLDPMEEWTPEQRSSPPTVAAGQGEHHQLVSLY